MSTVRLYDNSNIQTFKFHVQGVSRNRTLAARSAVSAYLRDSYIYFPSVRVGFDPSQSCSLRENYSTYSTFNFQFFLFLFNPALLSLVNLPLAAMLVHAIVSFIFFLAAVSVSVSVYASPAPPLAQIITKCTVPNRVALTFDDGPYLWLTVRSCATVAP